MSKLLVVYKNLLREGNAELSVNSFVGPAHLAQGTGWAHSSRTCIQLTIGKEFFQLTAAQARHLRNVLDDAL